MAILASSVLYTTDYLMLPKWRGSGDYKRGWRHVTVIVRLLQFLVLSLEHELIKLFGLPLSRDEGLTMSHGGRSASMMTA